MFWPFYSHYVQSHHLMISTDNWEHTCSSQVWCCKPCSLSHWHLIQVDRQRSSDLTRRSHPDSWYDTTIYKEDEVIDLQLSTELMAVIMKHLYLILVLLSLSLRLTKHHSIFLEPPSRPTLGRVKSQCGLRWNYQENELFCGGISVQHNVVNKGRCGICGDEYSGAHPHQAGGMWVARLTSRLK